MSIDLQEVPVKKWYKEGGNADIARVLELWRNGYNQREIQIISGVSCPVINQWISKHWFGYKGKDGITITLSSKV